MVAFFFVANALQTKKYKMNYTHADTSNHNYRLHKKQMKEYLFLGQPPKSAVSFLSSLAVHHFVFFKSFKYTEE